MTSPDSEFDQRVRAGILSEAIDTAALERSLRDRIQRPRIPRWAFAAAAGIILAIVSGVTYRTLFRPPTPPLCIAAAEDHRREIVNGEPRRWLTDVAAIRSLALKQGVPASAIPALGAVGYRLERGRLCFLKKQIFLHLVYAKDGDEISVYLRPRGSDSPFNHSVHEAFAGPEDLAYFQTDRLSTVFVARHNVLRFAVKQRFVLQ
ncbi:MAG: hypothetical protein JOZ32_15095 [Bryobacterales bacterium]|nr:hypothetical protein [Bryobacterales bacterium]